MAGVIVNFPPLTPSKWEWGSTNQPRIYRQPDWKNFLKFYSVCISPDLGAFEMLKPLLAHQNGFWGCLVGTEQAGLQSPFLFTLEPFFPFYGWWKSPAWFWNPLLSCAKVIFSMGCSQALAAHGMEIKQVHSWEMEDSSDEQLWLEDFLMALPNLPSSVWQSRKRHSTLIPFFPLSFTQSQTCIMGWWLSQPSQFSHRCFCEYIFCIFNPVFAPASWRI